MVQVDLKALLSTDRDTGSLIDTIQSLNSTLCVQDVEGNLILGEQPSAAHKQSISLNGTVIGWVIGQEQEARTVARLIGAEAEIDRLKVLEQNKDEWFWTAAHDLKAPLGLILGYTGLMQDGGTIANEEDLGFLDEIKGAGMRMNQLVLEVLDLMLIEDGKALELETMALQEVLNGSTADLEALIKEKHHSFAYTPPAADLMLQLDPVQMQRTFANLLANAVNFTLEGGQISLTTQRDGDTVTVTLSDTGIGIPADNLPHIFEKFHKVQRGLEPNKSTGLKMAIVKAIINGHGGDIQINSVEDEGTTVTVTLPVK
jgi:signal transduction histidine kinase